MRKYQYIVMRNNALNEYLQEVSRKDAFKIENLDHCQGYAYLTWSYLEEAVQDTRFDALPGLRVQREKDDIARYRPT